MAWKLSDFTSLNLDVMIDDSDVDLVRVRYKNHLLMVRLSACRITPIKGERVPRKNRSVLIGSYKEKQYDFTVANELARIIMRGSHNHDKVVWIKGAQGQILGYKEL